MKTLELHPPVDATFGYNEATRLLYETSTLTRSLELLQVPPSEIIQAVRPIRNVLSASPFINHLQTWPHGYQGDYEIVEHIMDVVNKSPAGSWAWYLEEAGLHSGIVQQHRNKVRLQADEISRFLVRRVSHRNMLSPGCGGCRDLFQLAPQLEGFQGEIVLNDTDASALALAKSRLSKIAPHLQIVRSNVLKAVRRLEREERKFSFVLAGGLFDYLPDKAVTSILRTIFHGLLEEDGGVCMFTNILAGNIFRPWMEYLVSWTLIERSAAHVIELCKHAGVPEDCISVATDDFKLALIIRVSKPAKSQLRVLENHSNS